MSASSSIKNSSWRRHIGLVLSVVTATALVAACGSSGSSGASSGGGKFLIRETSDWATLDPSNPAGPEPDLDIITALYDRLVAPGPNGTILPYLAKSWSTSPSAKSITFNLRPGLVCSDGTALTATDIANSFDRLFKSPGVEFALTGGPFTAVPNNSKNQITFTSQNPSPSALYGFASPFAGIICPAGLAAVKSNKNALVTRAYGSGPYTLVSATHNVGVVLKRNPKWNWGPDGLTWKDLPSTLDEEVIPSDTTAANELETGTLDGGKIAGTNVSRLLQDQSLIHVSTEAPKVLPMVMNQSPGHVTSDPQVRKAIIEAISPRAFSNAAFGNGFYALGSSIFLKGAPCYAPATESLVPAYSLSAAKQTLLNDGYTAGSNGTLTKNGKALAVTVLGTPDILGSDGTQYIAAQLTALGMSVTTLNEPSIAQFGAYYIPGKWDVTVVDMSAPNPAPSTFMSLLSGATPPNGTNFAYDLDPKITADVTAAESATGSAECPAWAKVQTDGLRDYDWLPLSSPKEFFFAKKGYSALFLSPTYIETETLHAS
jgi:peptide/nickel transport system substrate-binding protein